MLADVFLEAGLDATIIPFAHQNTFFALLGFEPDKAVAAVACATLGACFGIVVSWLVGKIIGDYLMSYAHLEAKMLELRTKASTFGWPLLLFIWVPLGSFLTLAAGALGIKLQYTLLLGGVSMLGYYVYQSLSLA